MTEPVKLPFYAKSTLILIGGIAFFYILYIGQSIFVPLIFALFIAILVNPVLNFLLRKRVNKIVAISLTLLLVMIVMSVLVFFIGMQVTMFSSTYPELNEKFNSTGTDIVNWCSDKFNIDILVIRKWISDTGDEISKGVTRSLGQTLLTVGNALVIIVVLPVYIFLILFYKHLLLEFIRKVFNKGNQKNVAEVLISVNVIIRSYLAGLLIEGAIVAALNSIGLLILGIKYAILLGITGAILNVIPYIGGVIAIALPMIIAFVTKTPVSALLVMIIYIVIQFIDNHYLIPSIVASKVKVNALVAVVVVLLGNLLWGVPGMFLSIPIVALVKVVFDHIDALKPWGFLLGDTMPTAIKLPFDKMKK